MDGVNEDKLRSFIELQLKLLTDEHEEEVVEFDTLLNAKSVVALENEGFIIRYLEILSISKVHGMCEVELIRSHPKKVQTVIGPGDTISINRMFSDSSGKEFIGCGIVISLSEHCIMVSMDEKYSSYLPDPQEEDKLLMVSKTASYVTYKRMKSALENIWHLEYSRAFPLVQILFGDGMLGTVPVSPTCIDSKGKLNFVNDNLHEVQKLSVEFALRQKNLAIIHGPPGTGKTTTLVEIILQLIKMGNKILICASSNIAVDTLVERLLKYKVNVVRVGHTARMLSGVKDYSLNAALTSGSNFEIMQDVKKEIQEWEDLLKNPGCVNQKKCKKVLKGLKRELRSRQDRAQKAVLLGSSVVLTTLVTACEDGPLRSIPCDHFDAVIVDECSQALEAACWIAIPKASKLILAGDHLQLPPLVRSKSAMEGGLGHTLMERAIDLLGPECYRLLTHQYRMHQDIMSWVSELYGGKLTADSSVEKHLLKDLPGVSTTAETNTALLFIDTASCDINEIRTDDTLSKVNVGEADVVVCLVKQLLRANVPPNVIGIITPYSSQVSCLTAKLRDHPSIEVRTVDGFQGREKEAVILSFVRSNNRGELGFVTDKRRLNVAVSRARRFLGIVADSETVGRDKTIKSLLDHIDQYGEVYSAITYLEDLKDSKVKLEEHVGVPSSRKLEKRKAEVKPSLTTASTASSSKGPNGPKQESPENGGKKHMHIARPNIRKEDGEVQKINVALNVLHLNSNNNNKVSKSKVESWQQARVDDLHGEKAVPCLVQHGGGNNLSTLLPSKSPEPMSGCRKKVDTNKCALGDGNFLKSNVQPKKVNTKIYSDIKSGKFKEIASDNRVPTKGDKSSKQNMSLKKFEDTSQEDFDTMINNYKKLHSVCNFPGCKTKINLMGTRCEFCTRYLCYTHALPEVHGCGEEVRRKARQEFKHPKQPEMNERQKELASVRLKKQVKYMAEKRKPEKK